jgi:hypothetical protein
MPDGSVALHERTRFVFRADGDTRSIERDTQLTAGDKPVAFPDNKEGVLGLRVARGLEQPADKPEVFTDASGKPTAVPVLDNTGRDRQLYEQRGLTGDKVWGTRGRWCALAGKVEGEDVVLLMLDHPKNPGYPTYWHARGYGLFAANPLGQAALSNGKETLNFALQPKATTTFRHRLLILPGPLLEGACGARGEGLRAVESPSAWPSRPVSSAAATSATRTCARRSRPASASPPSTAAIPRRPRRCARAMAARRSPTTTRSSSTGRWTWS